VGNRTASPLPMKERMFGSVSHRHEEGEWGTKHKVVVHVKIIDSIMGTVLCCENFHQDRRNVLYSESGAEIFRSVPDRKL
jgi:hypothetical protein